MYILGEKNKKIKEIENSHWIADCPSLKFVKNGWSAPG